MKTKNSFRSLKFAAVAAAALSMGSVGQAATSLVNSTLTNGTWINAGVQSTGYAFTLSSSQSLSQLGFFDMTNGDPTTVPGGAGNDGLLESHYIGLWSYDAGTTTATLLADGTVPSGGALGDDAFGFLYTSSITNHNGFTGTLSTGTTYILGATVQNSAVTAGDHYLYGVPALASATLLWAGYAGPADQAPQYGNYADSAFVGANLTFNAVPEPSTYALLLAGAAMLFALRRRRA